MIPVCLLLIIMATSLYAVLSMMKPKNFPPGPKWYPFIGSSRILANMTKKYGSQSKAFIELAKQHSTNILGLNISGELLVVVFGKENLRRVFMDSDFDARPMNFFAKLRCLGKENMGITFANGGMWRVHRQFAVKNLKNVGFGKTLMEREIQAELGRMLYYLRRSNYKPISIKTTLGESVMNILWKYVAGERIKENKLVHLLDLFRERSKAFSMTGGLLNQVPWCRYIIPGISGYSLITKINKEISSIIEEAINKHKNKEVEGKDFIYSFLNEIKNGDAMFTEAQLKIVCLDFLVAGSQTTSSATEFALLRALKSQDMQQKIQREIDAIIGDQFPSWNDSDRLIYTSAFLQECQRYYMIVPIAGPRMVSKDTVVDGYTIPKKSTVLMSMSNLHFDPKIWGDPHVFRPERFIDEQGLLKNSEHMLPFGLGVDGCPLQCTYNSQIYFDPNVMGGKPMAIIAGTLSLNMRGIQAMIIHHANQLQIVWRTGRRRCPGDSLARSFIFITFVGILQKFKVCANGHIPSDEPISGILSSPPPFEARFKLRKQNSH